jgi:hypothetical protein
VGSVVMRYIKERLAKPHHKNLHSGWNGIFVRSSDLSFWEQSAMRNSTGQASGISRSVKLVCSSKCEAPPGKPVGISLFARGSKVNVFLVAPGNKDKAVARR